MSVTLDQATSLLENVLYESASVAATNAQFYVNQSTTNTALSTVGGMASYFASLAEASIPEQVIRYYEGALGRAPAGSEIAYYVNIAEAGLTADQLALGASAVNQATWNIIANDFANSPEFQFATGGGVTTNIIISLYNNILGRTPSSSEIAYYQAQVSAGLGINTLIQEFTNSPEYQGNVNTSIQSTLGTYGAGVAAGTTNPNTPISTTVGGVKPVNYALTTGVDNLVATTSGANTFTGVLDNKAGVAQDSATFGGADSVTGLGSSNTLLLTDAFSTGTDLLPTGATITDIQTVTLKTAGNAGVFGSTYFDVSGIAGVTQLNVTSSGTTGDQVKAAATTNVSDTNLSTGAVSVAGGLNDVVTANGGAVSVFGTTGTISISQTGTGSVTANDGTNVTITAAGAAAINVDQTSASKGNVSVTETGNTVLGVIKVGIGGQEVGGTATVAVTTALDTGTTGGAITIVGGTVDTVTVNIAGSKAANTAQAASGPVAGTLTGGAIKLTSGTATTSFSVTQTAATAGVAGVAHVPANPGSTGTKAAPGIAAVAATSGTPAVTLVPGTLAVVDGGVTLKDANATVTTVSLTNYGNSTFKGDALKTLNLSGTAGTLTITENSAYKNTTLALNLNAVTAAPTLTNTITDGSNLISEIDVTTTGTSKVTSIADTALATLKVAGTGSLLLGSVSALSGLTTVAVSGSASFSDGGALATGLAVLGSKVASITTTSSGSFTAALDDATQTFVGSTGTDVITINANTTATKAITAGSATNNELILDGTLGLAGLASAATKVTGFQILGVSAANGTVDASVILPHATALDVVSGSAAGATIVTNLAIGANISIDASLTQNLTVGYAPGSETSTSISFVKNFQTTKGITVQDSNGNGIAALTLAGAASGSATTIATLTDQGLSSLTVTGKSALITKLSETSTQATALTITNNTTGSAGLEITTLKDDALGTINFAGTGTTLIDTFDPAGSITSLVLNNTGAAASIGTIDVTAGTDVLNTVTFTGSGDVSVGVLATDVATLTLNNSGTGNASISTLSSATLTKLTVTGNVALGANDGIAADGIQLGATTGVTFNASGDNSHININIGGAVGAGVTDVIKVGNSNNMITDAATTGFVNVTVGTGSNLIDINTVTVATNTSNITLGTHTASGPDEILVGHNLAGSVNVAAVINNAAAGDLIGFGNDLVGVTSAAAVSTATQAAVNALSGSATLTDVIATVHGAGITAHVAETFTWGGNTYVLEGSATSSTTSLLATDTLIEITGTHTLSSAFSAGGTAATPAHVFTIG